MKELISVSQLLKSLRRNYDWVTIIVLCITFYLVGVDPPDIQSHSTIIVPGVACLFFIWWNGFWMKNKLEKRQKIIIEIIAELYRKDFFDPEHIQLIENAGIGLKMQLYYKVEAYLKWFPEQQEKEAEEKQAEKDCVRNIIHKKLTDDGYNSRYVSSELAFIFYSPEQLNTPEGIEYLKRCCEERAALHNNKYGKGKT